jgi:tripartite-type tricarboxylate transporter receptor subunit TctC
MTRRASRALCCVGLMVAALASAGAAQAHDYPAQTVNIVVGYAAGGDADIAARVFADKMSTLAKQTFVVVNKPGESGNIAANE